MDILILIVGLVTGIAVVVAFVVWSPLYTRCPKCHRVVVVDAFVETESGLLRRKCDHCGHMWSVTKDGKERGGERTASEGISEQDRHADQRDEPWKRILGPVIVLWVGVVVTAYSVETERYERRIESLPVVDAAAFLSTDPGLDVIVTGLLEGIPGPGGLVAYERERYKVELEETGPNSSEYCGEWKALDREIPALAILVGGSRVNTVPASCPMEGKRHSKIVQWGTGMKPDWGDIPEGSIRVVGYKNGDVVTLVGQKADDGRLIPQHLYGGSRAKFLESVQFSEIWIQVGIGIMLVGLVILGIVTVPRGLARLVVKVQSLLAKRRRQ